MRRTWSPLSKVLISLTDVLEYSLFLKFVTHSIFIIGIIWDISEQNHVPKTCSCSSGSDGRLSAHGAEGQEGENRQVH